MWWPDAELATSKGTHCGAIGRTVLQAKIKIAVGTLDPFLNDETLGVGEDAIADALGLLGRSDFIAPRELGLGVSGGPSHWLDDAGKPLFCQPASVREMADRYRTWCPAAFFFGQPLKAR